MGDLVAGYFGYKGAQEQADAASDALGLQKKIWKQSREDMMPWLEAGQRSLADMEASLGSTYQASDRYDWLVSEGERGVLSNLSALGMSNSGSALKELTKFRTGLAAQDEETWYNRKAGLAGSGQQQSSALASLGQNYANAASQQYNALGAARGSGYVALGNGIGNALNDAIGFAGYGGGGGGASLSPMNYSNMMAGMGGLY